MRGIVTYYSKHGHAKEYAEMIADELGFDISDIRKINVVKLRQYDYAVFGSGVYIYKLKKLKKIMFSFPKGNLAIFACGGQDVGGDMLELVKEKNFNKEQLSVFKVFYLPGGIDINRYNGFMRFMFKMMKKSLEQKPTRTSGEEGLLQGIASPVNRVDKTHITELIECVKSSI